MRLKLHYPALGMNDNREFFHAAFRIDPVKMFEAGRDRRKLLEVAMLGHWQPYAVLPRATAEETIAFEARWDSPIYQPKLQFTLQIYTSNRRSWRDVAKWSMPWSDWWWNELTAGSSEALSVPPEGAPAPVEMKVPPNLADLLREDVENEGRNVNP